MTQHEIYQFLLCLITFTLLTVLFTVLVVWIVRLMARIIDSGLEDEKIKKEYLESQKKRHGCFGKVIDAIVLITFCVVFLFSFAFSAFVSVNEEKSVSDIPVIRVVKSGSMSYINKDHKYLKEGQVTDQIQMFDLVVINKLPSVEDLKVNDIVVYEADGVAIIHRIVAIEEPNQHHSDRRFLLHGDANKSADYFPVLYSQMLGIYSGTRIPMVGNFVMFLQSPAGYLCILLLVFAIIAVPIAEAYIQKRINARLLAMRLAGGVFPEEEKPEPIEEKPEPIEEKPEPIEEKPEPIEEKPEPIEEKPEPTEEKPEPITTEAEPIAVSREKRKRRTFTEKLAQASDELRTRYELINSTLLRFEGIRVIEGKNHHSYRYKRLPIARFAIKGKTLNIYLGLEPKEFENTKYIFVDDSEIKLHANYPMRLKLTSDRQTRWANELILLLAKKHGINLSDIPQSVEIESDDITTEDIYEGEDDTIGLRIVSRDNRSFEEKLDALPIAKERYGIITEYLSKIAKAREIRGRKQRTFKVGNIPLVRFTVRGKTLNAFIALNSKDFENTKYIYTDASDVNKYASYPMRVKVSSARQTRWTIELIGQILEKNGVKRNEI